MLVGGDSYPMELVEMRESWSGHHGYKKKVYYVVLYMQKNGRRCKPFTSALLECKAIVLDTINQFGV